jgi:DNA repair exonuclease SbcCD nuclease subunit
MNLRLLCIGDLHLGRRPSRLPAVLAQEGLDAAALGPRTAWSNAVQAALDERVDAVLLLGDVVDDERRFLEQIGPLEDGVRRLTAAGVEVVAVAGNHDVDVLPRIARAIPSFKLLGSGGVWEEHTISRDGRGAVRLVGWSFPCARVTDDPTRTLQVAALEGTPTLGLLHGDLTSSSSHHAPLSRAGLERLRFDAWLLGHIHEPSFGASSPPIGYLGSLVGLDPTECGRHGPWLIEVAPSAGIAARQLATSPLRWDEVELPVAGIDDARALEDALHTLLREFRGRAAGELGSERAVVLRVRLTGRHPRHSELARAARGLDLRALFLPFDGRLLAVESVCDDAELEVDLSELARASDPAGILARKLLSVRGAGSEDKTRLLAAARRSLGELSSRKPWSSLGGRELGDAELAAALDRAGLAALEALLARRSASA